MKKLLKFTTGIIVFAMLTSCGRTVQMTGENKVEKSNLSITTEIPVTTERPTEPPRATCPKRLKVDTDMPENYKLKDSCIIDGFEAVMQCPEIPTGCEITSLTQTLNFYGFDIDKVDLCDTFLPVDYEGYYTMNEVYLGDPHSEHGFGCNSSVIVDTADDYFEYIASDWYAKDLTGSTLQEIFYQVEKGRPVIVWSTINQIESGLSYVFTLGCGEDLYFNYYQHCLTVYGFDTEKNIVYVADPLEGNVEYDMSRFERIYNNMGNQAVILLGNDSSAGVVYSTEKEQKEWLKVNRPPEDEEQLKKGKNLPHDSEE